MRRLLTAFLTGALMLGATSGIATAAAGPSGGTIWVAHGIPGVKVDVCVDGAEARSNFKYGHAFAAVLETCRVWVNGEEADPDTQVNERDEVAILPPVSGG